MWLQDSSVANSQLLCTIWQLTVTVVSLVSQFQFGLKLKVKHQRVSVDGIEPFESYRALVQSSIKW